MFFVSFLVLCGTALIFYLIGAHAQNFKKPINFLPFKYVHASQIVDVKQYNKEVGNIFKMYSLWFLVA